MKHSYGDLLALNQPWSSGEDNNQYELPKFVTSSRCLRAPTHPPLLPNHSATVNLFSPIKNSVLNYKGLLCYLIKKYARIVERTGRPEVYFSVGIDVDLDHG